MDSSKRDEQQFKHSHHKMSNWRIYIYLFHVMICISALSTIDQTGLNLIGFIFIFWCVIFINAEQSWTLYVMDIRILL